ncbi:MAG: hypothetical protein KKF46_06225 [Nanoarchaeota archaeon]|nr:hypothetical protein [Nanoarchaeota archaeon]MBU1321928.1 hypothetical protein [Nanoarchaeota archaeon]MBU1597621.1 hypothetical protein [Nanoarchaeota archaeon]MBU2440989.1 hypothetical protein [Nanoarchaeota archaeon]
MNSKLEELKKITNELEALQKKAESDGIKLPEDWFWHRESINAIRNLYDSINEELGKIKEFEKEVASNRDIELLTGKISELLDYINFINFHIINVEKGYTNDNKDTQEIQRRINIMLNGLDSCLTSLIKDFKILEKKYSYQSYLDKRKKLTELGFNIFRYPEITELLIYKWSIVEEMIKIVKTDPYNITRFRYIWYSFSLFEELIYLHLPKEGIKQLINNNQVKPYLYQGPEFFNKHGAGAEIANAVKNFEQDANNLEKILVLISMIMAQATIGEHIDELVKYYMPRLRELMKSESDLEIIYSYAVKMYKKYPISSCNIIAETIPQFAELYHRHKEEFLRVFYSLLEKGSSKGIDKLEIEYLLRKPLINCKCEIDNLTDFKKVCLRLISLMQKWSKKEKSIGYTNIYDATRVIMLIVKSSKDLHAGLQILERIYPGSTPVLMRIYQLMLPYYNNSIYEFYSKDGKKSIDILSKIHITSYESENVRDFLNTILELSDISEKEDVEHIINLILEFFIREIQGSRIKTRNLGSIKEISKSIFLHYKEYILYLLEKSPSNFMKVLFNINYLVRVEENITPELIELTKICRQYHLLINEKKVEKIDPQTIENTYLFFIERLGRKPKLEKLRKNLNKFGTQHSLSAFEWINNSIINLSIDYFVRLSAEKIQAAFEKFCGMSLPPELQGNEDAFNALIIAKKCEYKNKDLAHIFIKELCLENMVPFKKYPEAYPYNQKKNIDFVREIQAKGINLEPWIKGFEKEYAPIFTDALANTEQTIKNHEEEVIRHYKELKLDVKKEEIFEKFEQIKEHPNKSMVQDIKQHLQAIKSLQGQNIFIKDTKKIKIYVETNPLKILQMGNVVSGSCLSVDGGSPWTTITNATDVNKNVLYAENEKGTILGRRLISMTNNGRIIQYQTYNNALEIDLDILFEKFTIELAQACKTQVADDGKTSVLVGESWYAGTDIQVFRTRQAAKQEKEAESKRPMPELSPSFNPA